MFMPYYVKTEDYWKLDDWWDLFSTMPYQIASNYIMALV
jgi:hypothetical protein